MSAEQGQTFKTSLLVDRALIERFAELSGDRNPIHLDAGEAKAYGYPRQVAHGAILVALVSKAIGMDIPGPGALWLGQTVEWLSPVFVGDEICLTVTVEKVSAGAGVIFLALTARNQEGKDVMRGSAKVKATQRLATQKNGSKMVHRVALVTGAAGGLGAAIARRLAADGVAVAAAYRGSKDAAERLVAEVVDAGGNARVFAADLSDPSATARLAEQAASAFGRLDVVVHAASPRIVSIEAGKVRYEDIEPYLKVYLGGAATLVSALAPGMFERKFGRFIFLGTAAMLGAPSPKWAPYLTAKHALWGFVKSLAVELGPSGITSNMVSPGMTVTELTADIPARVKEVEARTVPMRRLAEAEDTAELVAFLAAPNAGYINGANLPVTGGPK